MVHRIAGERLSIAIDPWRSVLAAGSTVGAPAKEAVYGTSYRNYTGVTGNDVAYYKDPFGVVHITGACEKTVAVLNNDTLLTLPVGYRPNQSVQWMGMIGTQVSGAGLPGPSVSRMVILPWSDATKPGAVVLQGAGATNNPATGAGFADATLKDLLVVEISFRVGGDL